MSPEAPMAAITIPCIIPIGIYDDAALHAVLAISGQTLARARKDGALRYTRKGQRILYLGQWVLDWLTEDRPRGSRS
jgi:hypothetical protein